MGISWWSNITWASGEPEASFKSVSAEIERIYGGKATVEKSAQRPMDTAAGEAFLRQLASATGVFFTGGDQNRVMEELKNPAVLRALQEKYEKGVPFAGTSAGTAIMSPLMITGDGDFTVIDGSKVATRPGIGLLPESIVDQHFIKRQRQNRLIGLLMKNQGLIGIGIDEDTAFAVSDNRVGEVIGNTQVMIFDARKAADSFRLYLLANGEKFDLRKRKRTR